MGFLFVFIILPALLGLIPASIAQSKGRDFVPWWIYGALIFIVALPHALMLKPDTKQIEREAMASGGRKCPFCAEIIKAEAVVCRFCGRDLPEVTTAAPAVRREGACPRCGQELRRDGQFCRYCGWRVEGVVDPVTSAMQSIRSRLKP